MQRLPKPNLVNDSIRNAFIATSITLYLQACHLQSEEEADVILLSFLIANANTGKAGGETGRGEGKGNSGLGSSNNGGDEGDDETNLGSSLVNNTGQVTAESDFLGVDDKKDTEKNEDESRQAEPQEEVAATSPGGTGESRIIGGVTPEDDQIDWTDVVDDGTKDADAATG